MNLREQYRQVAGGRSGVTPPNMDNDGIELGLFGDDNGWWGDENETITFTWKKPVKAKRLRIVFDSDFSGFKRMRCNYPKDYPPVTMPAMLAKDFVVEVYSENKWKVVHHIKDNRHRLVMLDLEKEVIGACRLRLKSAWGQSKMHVYSFEVA